MSEDPGVDDPFRHADKQQSWNDFGSAFWELAGDSSHPSDQEVASFLSGVSAGSRVLVLGATTTGLIEVAVAAGARVHVLDFADKLLELADDRFGADVRLHHHDLIDAAPPELARSFDVVIGDRLVNRFHRSEMGQILANMVSFVAPRGELRVSIRFGLYPLDERLLARGEELGTRERFWDDASRTLDWGEVGRELDDVATAHGDIPREVVIAWSRQRGVESRLEPADLDDLIDEASAAGRPVRIDRVLEMDLAPDSRLYCIGDPR